MRAVASADMQTNVLQEAVDDHKQSDASPFVPAMALLSGTYFSRNDLGVCKMLILMNSEKDVELLGFKAGTSVMAPAGPTRPLELLLVEDNPGDVRLTKEALKDGEVAVNLNVARDGVEAMDFLRRRDRFRSAPVPDLILLDLNLPRKNGREVLSEVKADPELKKIPVLVMTTSRAEQDITRAYSLNANCYITKPMDLDEFLRIVKSIEEFWMKTVTLPSVQDGNAVYASQH